MLQVEKIAFAYTPQLWEEQCVTVYNKTRAGISDDIEYCDVDEKIRAWLKTKLDDLSNLEAEKIVSGFGSVLYKSNLIFVPHLLSLLRLPPACIPDQLRPNLAEAIAFHRQKVTEHEVAPEMKTLLDIFYEAAKDVLNGKGDPILALHVGSEYMSVYAQRAQAAKDHIAQGWGELAASPDRAVAWCQTLTGFTRKEAAADGQNLGELSNLLTVFSTWVRTQSEAWPGAGSIVSNSALSVINKTRLFVGSNMMYIDINQPGYASAKSPSRDDLLDAIVNYSCISPFISANIRMQPNMKPSTG